jgi:uncharacterized protein YwgA
MPGPPPTGKPGGEARNVRVAILEESMAKTAGIGLTEPPPWVRISFGNLAAERETPVDRYQLAKLVQWSGRGGLQTRKRLQKVVSLLRAAGCPIEAEYTLHLYGPYSIDVAQRTDEMVAAKLLEETPGDNGMGGTTFSYRLSKQVEAQLPKLDAEPSRGEFLRYEKLARRLLAEQPRKLELASTLAHIYAREQDWGRAREATAQWKREAPDGPVMQDAERLARDVVEGNAG